MTIITLISNAGLFLAISSIIVIPSFVLHTKIGLEINKLENCKTLIIISMVDLLLFSLVRPDGVHIFNKIGLESWLQFFGFYITVNSRLENYCLKIAIVLIAFQIILDLIILMRLKRNEKHYSEDK